MTPPLEASQDGLEWPGSSSGAEDEPLKRIRAYAPIQTRIALPSSIGSILDSWKIGEDPSEFEFFVDPEEGVPRYRQDRKKIRKQKQLLGQIGRADSVLGAFGGSQPPSLLAASTQMIGSSQIQGPSQSQSRGPGITMSQVEHGKHGGRKQKKRKTGF
jgi:hypothetical protein